MFPKRLSLYIYLLIGAVVASPAVHAAKLKIPQWLSEASVRQVALTKETAAVTLHDEAIITIATNGRMTKTIRQAYRVVTRDGRSVAGTVIPYDLSSQKITDFKAWLVRPNGEGKTYSTKDTIDVATAVQSVYAESRMMTLSASGDAFEECVFGYEYTISDRGAFAEERWWFHSGNPVALSRLVFNLPKGWTVMSKTLAHAPIEPVVSGDTYVWEMRDLPAYKEEPMGPPMSRMMPRLCVDVVPPATAKNVPLVSFSDWKAVSVYLTGLHSKSCLADSTVTAKASALLASTGGGLWERINVLARHAQAVNYVSIAMNVGRGGGYTPRNAPDVLKTGYGDCKDKTALLRALLSVAGIESYAVVIYSGDRYQVTAEWPTANQFNHAITAIKIDDASINSPAIVNHPTLGRLLFFDPTDPYTPLGDLPYEEQGSYALVLAGENGELMQMPLTSPMENHLDRSITAVIDAAGSIAGSVVESFTGQAAVMERAFYRSPRGKYADSVRNWINDTVRAAKILKTDVLDEQAEGRFKLTAQFAAPGYAQSMKGKLLIFKPTIVGRRDFVPLTKPERTYPVVLWPRSYTESSDVRIPDGFKIEELPPSVETQTSFGRYSAACTFDEATHQVKYRRTLVMNAAEVPASDYASVRAFYETIRKAENTNVVLSRVQ